MRYRLTVDLLRPGEHLAFWGALHVVPEGGDRSRRDPARVRRDREGVPEGTEFSTPETLPDSRAEIEASGLFSDTVWILGASVKSLRLGLWRLP